MGNALLRRLRARDGRGDAKGGRTAEGAAGAGTGAGTGAGPAQNAAAAAAEAATAAGASDAEAQATAFLAAQMVMRPQELVLDQLLLLLPLEVDREELQVLLAAGAAAGAAGATAAGAERASGAALGTAAAEALRRQSRVAACPDALAAAARAVVTWAPAHGARKGQRLPLLPTRLFLVQTNVAVEEYGDGAADPRPYGRAPSGPSGLTGSGVRYVLRPTDTQAAAEAAARRRRRALASGDADAPDPPPPSGAVRLFATVLPPPATDTPPSTEAGPSADSGTESGSSARSSGDPLGPLQGGPLLSTLGGPAGVSVEDPLDGFAEGGPRSPKDPLPPVPVHQQASGRRLFGPSEREQRASAKGRQRGSQGVVPALMPSERRLSGVVPGQRQRPPPAPAPPAPAPQPPPPDAAPAGAQPGGFMYAAPRSSGGSTRTADSDYDYGYAGSSGSWRGGSAARSGPLSLREGEIPAHCFREISAKRSEVQWDAEAEAGAGADAFPGAQLFVERRFLYPSAYARALGLPPGLHTPWGCNVKHALPQAEWPAHVQLHWQTRQRMRWPSPEDVAKVCTLGCLLVPSESRSKKKVYEWDYAFPAAEAHLESTLSGSQIRVLLAAAALVRAAAEGLAGGGGGDSEGALEDGAWAQWLRHAFFWQCERHAMGTREQPGHALRRLLDALYDALVQRRLKDFFVPARNLLLNADFNNVCVIQERLSRARENLLLYMVAAGRGLKTERATMAAGEAEDDVPERASPHPLDMHRLYTLLTTDDFVTFMNPSLGHALQEGGGSMLLPGGAPDAAEDGDGDGEDDGAEGAEESGGEDEEQRWLRRFRRQVEAEQKAARRQAAPRASVDSIDLAGRVGAWEPLRRALLLDLLVDGLLARAAWAHAHGLLLLARLCARQAARMALLLADDQLCGDADASKAAALHRRAKRLDALVTRARDRARRPLSIELRRTSRTRALLESAREGAEAGAGESGVATDGEGWDESSRRYSTIAEVHAEVAQLLAAEKEKERSDKELQKTGGSVSSSKTDESQISSRNNSNTAKTVSEIHRDRQEIQGTLKDETVKKATKTLPTNTLSLHDSDNTNTLSLHDSDNTNTLFLHDSDNTNTLFLHDSDNTNTLFLHDSDNTNTLFLHDSDNTNSKINFDEIQQVDEEEDEEEGDFDTRV